MKIIDLNQSEISAVSGGTFYTLTFANIGSVVGTGVGILLLLTKRNYYAKPKLGLALAFNTACNNMFYCWRGINGTLYTALAIAGGCVLGTLGMWSIVKPLSLVGIINLD